MKSKKFKLSPTGKLAASMAIILATCSVSFAHDITPGGDAAHSPDVMQADTGATVVNIVAPSESGLSHNQYQDFNVNQTGAVFNNSLEDGTSQLAGELSANSNLNGQVASVILNEVISRNPSFLLGEQEIFGIAADYVLANPNGITCDGCGFINTNQASLVVGNPLVESGILQGFNTFDNQNALNIRTNGLSHHDVLNLIAPKIDINGQVITTKSLNITTGNNKISADGRILDTQQANINALDSYYLGSMRAGRIRLLNTAEGSGVNLKGQVTANDGIEVESYGDVKLEAAELKGGDITLSGKNVLSQGRLNQFSSDKTGSNNHDSTFSGIYTEQKQISESVARTQLAGKNITLVARQNNHVMATDIEGDNIKLTGANLKLDGQQLHQLDRNTNNQREWGWQYDVTNESEKYQHEGNTVNARENIQLTASEGDAEVLGSKIKAGNQLSVSAQKNVKLAGLVESEMTLEKGYKKNHRASLQTGNWNEVNSTQRSTGNELSAGGDLGIKAKGNVDIIGTQINSGKNLLISADQQTHITVQSLVDDQILAKDKTYWGGIAGGSKKDNRDKSETHHISEVTADGHLLLTGTKGVTITGSNVKAQKGAYVQANEGPLIIDNAVSYISQEVDERKGTIFNITKNTNQEHNKQQKSSGSQLISDVDLKLLSNKDINVIGSLAKSAGKLQLNTSGNINILNYSENNQYQQEKTHLDWQYYAKEMKDNQYRAGVGFEHTTDKQKNESTTQRPSELNGGSLSVNASNNVTVTGSKLVTTHGDAKISGNNIALLAGENSTSTSASQEKLSSSVFVTGGMDKLGSGVEGTYNSNGKSDNRTTAEVTKTQVTGNLELNAMGELKQQGTDHQVQGSYQANAGSIKNVATANTASSSTHQLQASGEISGTADYSATTRPVEKTARAAADKKLDASITKTGLPNAGIELTMNGNSRYTNNHQSNAVVTTIKADDVNVTTNGDIYDQGTQYQANKGGVSLTAGSHTSEAATNSQRSHTADTTGNASLRVYTTTGADISVNGKGSGSYQETSNSTTRAVTSGINTQNGVNVQVTRDARYQGTSINAGEGSANVKAGGNIQFNQATNRNEKQGHGYNGEISLTVGTNPDGKNFSGSLGGGYNTANQNNTTAQTSNITGGQGVNLNAGNNLTLQGANVSAKQVDLTAQRGKIELISAQDTASAEGWHVGAKAKGGMSSTARKEGGDGAAGHASTTNDPANRIFDNKYNMGGELKLGVNNLTQTTHHNAQVSGGNVNLTSAGDTSLKGANVDADQVTGNVGGNFNVESRKDSIHSLNVGLDAGVGYSKTVKGDAASKQAVPTTDALSENITKTVTETAATGDAKTGDKAPSLTDQLKATFKGFNGKLKGNYDSLDRETVGKQTALTGTQGVNLDVSGTTSLMGSKIDSAQGAVSLNTPQINQQSVAGYDKGKNLGINVPDSLTSLATSAQKDIFSGKVPFVKNEGHDTELPTIHSEVKGRQLD
ncbi:MULTISPECIES: hemagglutinin repeat-containing protein [Xenorhabdus]|uniref:hemagglutinin repeat-containing protein n=1 Tax=Xenorhabdus TaxID=626 RepID=UPI00064A043D|nr:MULTISPECIES: hemagglutinin repeat-containing protein [Xenorhabdus]KLU15044.1 hemolysin activation protein [Xenorhabdus griffiniae]KOP34515.1 hemolysin activation protein [Xenorhabdus sp. GDc328]